MARASALNNRLEVDLEALDARRRVSELAARGHQAESRIRTATWTSARQII